jgi:hypothetical protein
MGVRDILLDGMEMLTEKSMYEHWLRSTGASGTDLYGTDSEAGMMGGVEDFDVEPAFANLNGRMEVDSALDPEFEAECPFTNL